MNPGRVCASGHEGGFESTVHPFDHAVGFGVVGRRMVTLRTKELVEGDPEEKSEGGTPVGGNVFGDAKSGDPCGEEGGGAGGR